MGKKKLKTLNFTLMLAPNITFTVMFDWGLRKVLKPNFKEMFAVIPIPRRNVPSQIQSRLSEQQKQHESVCVY